jgi:hypothetical protein
MFSFPFDDVGADGEDAGPSSFSTTVGDEKADAEAAVSSSSFKGGKFDMAGEAALGCSADIDGVIWKNFRGMQDQSQMGCHHHFLILALRMTTVEGDRFHGYANNLISPQLQTHDYKHSTTNGF